MVHARKKDGYKYKFVYKFITMVTILRYKQNK